LERNVERNAIWRLQWEVAFAQEEKKEIAWKKSGLALVKDAQIVD
jgi:hypothetical protein